MAEPNLAQYFADWGDEPPAQSPAEWEDTLQTCTALCGTWSCALAWANNNPAVVVALIALVFTAWQLMVARRHNRLSVRPRLVLWLQEAASKRGNPLVTLIVKNYGLGPAFLKEPIVFRVGGRKINMDDHTALHDGLVALFGDKWAEVRPMFHMSGHYAIPKDGELSLIELEVDPSLANTFVDVLHRRVSIEIPYRSAYDELFPGRWRQGTALAR